MFPFGHLGIGGFLARPFVGEGPRRLSRRWVLLGTLLPDLIDKPLYYSFVLATGARGAELGLISGTRTFGHTALFLLLLGAVAWIRHSRRIGGICVGMATHLFLDQLGDPFLHGGPGGEMSDRADLLFPLLGFRFPVSPYPTLDDHLGSFFASWIFAAELIGAVLLGWELWLFAHGRGLLSQARGVLKSLRGPRGTRGRRPSSWLRSTRDRSPEEP